jgi:hypothetical protein
MFNVARRCIFVLTLVGVAALSGIALAARPKPFGLYADKHSSAQADKTGKKLSSFDGDCTAVRHPNFTFAYFWGIPVAANGKFHADHRNAVNTPDGGTISKSYRVTITGKFVSKKEAKGSYQLHKPGCKTIKFDIKLSK